jgi:hypothetical protein
MKVRLNKTILSDPNRFIYDGYSMWNFVELDLGIIAGSLPAIKPLLNGFLNAARGLTNGPSKPSAQGDRDTSGYQRHDHQSERDISLVDYGTNGRPAVEIITKTPDPTGKVVWNLARSNGGEDSILPHHGSNDRPKFSVNERYTCELDT